MAAAQLFVYVMTAWVYRGVQSRLDGLYIRVCWQHAFNSIMLESNNMQCTLHMLWQSQA